MEKCKECGGEAKFKYSSGGFDIYVVVKCFKCGKDTRGKGVLRGLIPLGMDIAQSDSAPQNSEEEALERWNEINVAPPVKI